MIKPLQWWEGLDRPLARLPRWAALVVLAALAAAMAWSVVAVAPVDQAETAQSEARPESSEGDLALYRAISQRMAEGEGYYQAAMTEHRARNYPTMPFVTVRPPALAELHQLIGVDGARYLAMALLLACLAALHFRLDGRVDPKERIGALVMLALGGAAVAAPQAGLIHEVMSGLLLTLAFLLYSPQRRWPSLIAVVLAMFVRELAVCFVLLWLAFSVMERRWKEAAILIGLLAIFATYMFTHYLNIEALRMSGDRASQGWDAMLGYGLPLMAISRLSALLVLPVMVAAPLAILPLLGWLGMGGRMGLFAALWFAGFFTAMALFARPVNFYWAQLLLPAYMVGLAFAPRALVELFHKSFAPKAMQN